MNENYLVLMSINEFVSAYKTTNAKGEIIDDVESQEMVRRSITALINFFAENNLLNDKKITETNRELRRDDFTPEGLELFIKKGGAWLKSKASKKDPPNIKLLEKALFYIKKN
ncbi:hypothetical protein HA050_20835 [Iodobacter sp. HSC-16F04]|uniref:Uncharacterized protein n=1 Tax=Iodobacter violaceini TaxID=3044271 RepID=A0ABX0L7E4_9NEIS|nr:hypothetical protein [Iodobacter violacea]NHQ88548.1 hypothetical protein [Iodobacter violacea]